METPVHAHPPPGLLRRLAAMAYDALVVGGLLLLAGGPLPLIPPTAQGIWWVRLLIQGYLLMVCFVFFGWFWVHGGQTIGMRAWRIRVVQESGDPPTWLQAAIRFSSALLSWAAFGLGFLWIIFDPSKRGWHDYISRTRLVQVPKETARHLPSSRTEGPE